MGLGLPSVIDEARDADTRNKNFFSQVAAEAARREAANIAATQQAGQIRLEAQALVRNGAEAVIEQRLKEKALDLRHREKMGALSSLEGGLSLKDRNIIEDNERQRISAAIQARKERIAAKKLQMESALSGVTNLDQRRQIRDSFSASINEDTRAIDVEIGRLNNMSSIGPDLGDQPSGSNDLPSGGGGQPDPGNSLLDPGADSTPDFSGVPGGAAEVPPPDQGTLTPEGLDSELTGAFSDLDEMEREAAVLEGEERRIHLNEVRRLRVNNPLTQQLFARARTLAATDNGSAAARMLSDIQSGNFNAGQVAQWNAELDKIARQEAENSRQGQLTATQARTLARREFEYDQLVDTAAVRAPGADSFFKRNSIPLDVENVSKWQIIKPSLSQPKGTLIYVDRNGKSQSVPAGNPVNNSLYEEMIEGARDIRFSKLDEAREAQSQSVTAPTQAAPTQNPAQAPVQTPIPPQSSQNGGTTQTNDTNNQSNDGNSQSQSQSQQSQGVDLNTFFGS